MEMTALEVYAVLGTGILIVIALVTGGVAIFSVLGNATQRRLTKLEDGQAKLEDGQAKLEDGQAKLEAGQAKLEIELKEIKNNQSKLEARQAHFEMELKEIKKDVALILERLPIKN